MSARSAQDTKLQSVESDILVDYWNNPHVNSINVFNFLNVIQIEYRSQNTTGRYMQMSLFFHTDTSWHLSPTCNKESDFFKNLGDSILSG